MTAHTHGGTDAPECTTCTGQPDSEQVVDTFPQRAPWMKDSRIAPAPPVSPEEEAAFSDQALLDNGFEQTRTTFRKQVFPGGPEPVTDPTTPLEPMTAPPFLPRTGYLRTPPPPPPISPRAELLREAETLITGERNVTYGEPTSNFTNIAALLNVQFAHKLRDDMQFTAADVAQIQIHIKMARMIAQPQKDNYVDIAGYAACGWEAQVAE